MSSHASWIGNPLQGFGICFELLVKRNPRTDVELTVRSRPADTKRRGRVGRVGLPEQPPVFEDRKPRRTTAGADLVVDEAVLPIAERGENHGRFRISAGDKVNPARRHNGEFARTCFDRKAAARIRRGMFLHVNDDSALPEFKELRRRPARVRSSRMNVTLRANRFAAETSGRKRDHAKEQPTALKFGAVHIAANVHADAVNGIRAIDLRVQKAGTDGIERALLGSTAKDTRLEMKRE